MAKAIKKISLLFSAGVVGGVMNALAVGWYSQTLAPPMLYQRMVWGGLWGILFLLPFRRLGIYWRGLLFSLAPTLVQWLIVFPARHQELFGTQLGSWTFLKVIIFNSVWGLAAAFWLKLINKESTDSCRN